MLGNDGFSGSLFFVVLTDVKVDIGEPKVDIQNKKVDIESVLSEKGKEFSEKTTLKKEKIC